MLGDSGDLSEVSVLTRFLNALNGNTLDGPLGLLTMVY